MPEADSNATTRPTIAPDINAEDATRLTRIYDSVSKNIERENALISFRISWAIFLSAGIVASETFIVNYVKDYHAQDVVVAQRAQVAVVSLSALAAFFCFMSRRGVKAAQAQMEVIKTAYTENAPNLEKLGFPQPFGKKPLHKAGNYNANVFPWVLMAIWIGFSGAQVYRLAEMWFRNAPDKSVSVDAVVTQKLDGIIDAVKGVSAKIDALKPTKGPR
jgi:hypothetical protein